MRSKMSVASPRLRRPEHTSVTSAPSGPVSGGCAQTVAQIADVELRPIPRQDHRALDGVLELADVSRPAVPHDPIHGFACQALGQRTYVPPLRLEEVIHQEGDVFAPLAQRSAGGSR